MPSRPNASSVRADIIKTLIERDVLAVTVYPDVVQVVGGHDSDDVVVQINGAYTQDEVARWMGVTPDLIEVSNAGPVTLNDIPIIDGRGL